MAASFYGLVCDEVPLKINLARLDAARKDYV